MDSLIVDSAKILPTSANISFKVNRIMTGAEIIHSENLNILINKVPVIQMDMSKNILLTLRPTAKIFLVYSRLLSTWCNVFVNGRWNKFDCWEDYFSRQIGTKIDPNNLTFETMAIN